MGGIGWARTIAAGVLVVAWLPATWLSWHWPQRRRTKAATTYLSRHDIGGADARPTLQATTERFLVARAHGQHVATSIGFVAMIAVVVTLLFEALEGLHELSLFVWHVPMFWSQAVGGVIGIGRAARSRPDEPRVAHLPQPTVADHLQPALRWWDPAMLAVAAVLVVVDAVFPTEIELLSSAAAVAALGLAAVSSVAAEGLVRWLLRVPQAPADADELRLLDTFQGEAVGSVAFGVIPTLLVAILLLQRFPIGPGAQLVLAVFVIAMFTLDRDRRRHMRDRLWPTPPVPPPPPPPPPPFPPPPLAGDTVR